MGDNDATKPQDSKPEKPLAISLDSLQFDFAPSWAKSPPKQSNYAERPDDTDRRGGGRDRYSGGRGGEQRRDRPTRRDDRAPRTDRPRPAGGAPQGGTTGSTSQGGDRRPRPEDSRRPAPRDNRPPYEPEEPINLSVSFLPDQKSLHNLIRQMRASKRGYSIIELAVFLLNHPEAYHVKVEPGRAQEPAAPMLFQCRVCRAVFLDRQALLTHLFAHHMGDVFETVETQIDPPSGQFNCVAVCGLTGALLGPPNHHTFGERVRQIQTSRFADMPLEEYKSRIKTVHEPEMVEKWKEESRKLTVYRLKSSTEESASGMKWADAEAYFNASLAPSMIQDARKVMIPGTTAVNLEDRRMFRGIKAAYDREVQYPLFLSCALRAVFKRMHLYLFKYGRNVTYVTTVRPLPLDPSTAAENVKIVLTFLETKAESRRDELVATLHPNQDVQTQEVNATLTTLTWLVEKGHVIELANGTLLLPTAVHVPTQEPYEVREEKPSTDAETNSSEPGTDETIAPLDIAVETAGPEDATPLETSKDEPPAA